MDQGNEISARERRRMSAPVTLLALLLSAVAVTLLAVCIQPGSFMDSLRIYAKAPLLIPLNGLPAIVLITVIYMLFGNVFAGASVSALVLGLLSYANRLKIEGRNDPLVPADIQLLRESLNAVGEYQLDLHPMLIALIVLFVLGFAVLAILCPSARLRVRARMVSLLLALGVFGGCLATIYPSQAFYDALPDTNKANVPQVYNTYGVIYCFLHNLNLYPVDKPEGYDAAVVEQWETETLEPDTPKDVNIVFILGEAFTDMPDEPEFSYDEEANPIHLYHQLTESDQAISGHMTVSGFGAGTANTEFDILTGMQTETIAEHTTSSFRVVHRSLDSLARVYLADGYRAWLLHPGQSWFYNRCSVYPYFGITEHTFMDAFTDADYNGSYITDAAFEEHLSSYLTENGGDGHEFVFSISIENHQAYTYDKFDHPVSMELPTDANLTDSGREQLEVYFYGLQHTSEMLWSLTRTLDDLDAPTMLVFFGDHRPALGADFLAYREVGSPAGQTDTPEQVLYSYETPWLIWGNEALCRSMDLQQAAEALELCPGNRISSNYLGSLVYELTGRRGSSAYWDALTQLRRVLPVLCQGNYVLPDGTVTQTLNDEQAAAAQKLRWWEYYRLKNGLDAD